MKPLLKRLVFAGLFFSPVLDTIPFDEATAAMTVIDISNLKQNTLTAVRTAQQIQNQLTMISNQVKTLTTLPSSTFGQIKGIYDSNMRELNGIIDDVSGISFDLNQIGSQYDQLYPQGQWSNMSSGQYADILQKWNTELANAAKIAMKAQSTLSRSQDYTNETIDILNRSSGADGEVRQLQSTNQMLGIVSAQLGGLTENLATSTRITAMMAAEEAQRREASAAWSTKLMKGFGGYDTTVHGVTLPEIK
ncbi:MAG: conjugal transfer protein [Chlorobiaceae bacterium]|nr:conjugal transfer protein [Chlorobiaceae bacterium]